MKSLTLETKRILKRPQATCHILPDSNRLSLFAELERTKFVGLVSVGTGNLCLEIKVPQFTYLLSIII